MYCWVQIGRVFCVREFFFSQLGMEKMQNANLNEVWKKRKKNAKCVSQLGLEKT